MLLSPTLLICRGLEIRKRHDGASGSGQGPGCGGTKIKGIARDNRVPIVENKPLARALYAAVEVGGSVPQELFKAVAEVLAYVYKLKHRHRRRYA